MSMFTATIEQTGPDQFVAFLEQNVPAKREVVRSSTIWGALDGIGLAYTHMTGEERPRPTLHLREKVA